MFGSNPIEIMQFIHNISSYNKFLCVLIIALSLPLFFLSEYFCNLDLPYFIDTDIHTFIKFSHKKTVRNAIEKIVRQTC